MINVIRNNILIYIDEFIMEETESTAHVPDWKIDLCQKRIKYMLLEEDEGVHDNSFLDSKVGSKMNSVGNSNQKGGTSKTKA
jgi:hypothetical protein